MGVGRISQFHTGAGIKNQLSLPFPESYEKRTSWDIIFSPRSTARQAKSSSNEMAPTIAPKINPTLRTGMGSTAGARDGSPAAEGGSAAAKRQKMAEGKVLRVSSNFNGVKRCANPPRLATAKATADASLGRLTAAKAAADAKGPEVIPSDEDDKPIDDALSASTSKPRKSREGDDRR
jgi:hypothetical protein